MTTRDKLIEEVAHPLLSKLTDAQKDAILGRYSWPSPWDEELGEIELVELGLWNELYGEPAKDRLTPLGLTLRHLLEKGDQE